MAQAVTAVLTAGPEGVIYPRFWAGSTVNVRGRLLQDNGEAVQGEGVSFLFRLVADRSVQIELGGIWDVAAKLWRCGADLGRVGTWEVRLLCLAPQRQTDWMPLEVVETPGAGNAPAGSLWVSQQGQALVTMSGAGLTGVRITELLEITDPAELTFPGVRADGTDGRVSWRVIEQGAQEAIAGDVQAVETARQAVDADAQAVEMSRRQVETHATEAAASEAIALDAADLARDHEVAARGGAEGARDTTVAAASSVSAALAGPAVRAETLSALTALTTVPGTTPPLAITDGMIGEVWGVGPDRGQYRRRVGVWVYESQTLSEVSSRIQAKASSPGQSKWLARFATKSGFVLAKYKRLVGTNYADMYLPGSAVLARDPSNAMDATTLRWVQAAIAAAVNAVTGAFLPRSGGTLTGPLTVPGATLRRGGGGWWRLLSPSGFGVGRLDKVGLRLPGGTWRHDGAFLPRGPVQLLTNPSAPEHAARKQYVDASDAATLQAAKDYADTHGGGGGAAAEDLLAVRRVQITTRAGHTQGTVRTDVAECNMRLWMPVSQEADWHDIIIRLGNHDQSGTADGAQAISYRMAIEYPAGEYHPIWFGGSRDVTVQPGAIVDSTPLLLAIAQPGFWLRVHVSLAAGGTLVQSLEVMQPSEGSGANFGSATDQTTGGTIAASYGYAPMIPLAVLGRPSRQTSRLAARSGQRLIALGIAGDSIATGTGDVASSGGSPYLGWAARAAAAFGIGYARISVPGQRFNNFDTMTRQRRRFQALEGVTHVICNFGTNDITQGGIDLAALKARSDAVAARIQQTGRRYIPATLTPRTDAANAGFYGTDTAATTALRLAFNDYLRTNPYGAGIYDLAALLSDGSNPQFWTAAYGATPADGLHPTTAMHAAAGADLAAKFPALLT